MSIGSDFLPEFDQEAAITRRFLERVPADKFTWTPHAKSTPLGSLAIHLAEIPSWIAGVLHSDSLDIAPKDGPGYQIPELKTSAEILSFFDKNLADGRAALSAISDEAIRGTWSLLSGGNVVFTLPKTVVLRTWVLSHTVHHRAQLGVYLRLNDVPVPMTYGPSADEGSM